MNEKKEIWKNIYGYNGFYEVSNFGRVRSLRFEKIKLINISKMSSGYLKVTLFLNGKRFKHLVHTLVTDAFLVKKNKLDVVNHMDLDKTNNNLNNLEFVSVRENVCHKILSNKRSSKYVGVTFCKRSKKWRSQIVFNGRKKSLGYFNNEEEAFESYLLFCKNNNITNKYKKRLN